MGCYRYVSQVLRQIINFYQMKRQNLFQSPLANPFSFAQLLHKDQQVQDSQALRMINTPGPMTRNRASPFNIYQQQQRLFSPQKVQQLQEQEITPMQRIAYSQEEEHFEEQEQQDEQKVQTPQKQIKIKQEVHSTGTKSLRDKLIQVKKSRPKQKGLRGLSARAYKVVLQLKSTTYKEVAVRLLKQLDFKSQLDNATQQTNVKRRVYDALNVLIAVGILQKEGRKIITRHSGKGPMANHNEIQLSSLVRKLKVKEENVKEKRKKLQQTKQKLRGIQSLIEKNRKNKHRIERSGLFIGFPFVGIADLRNWKVQQRTQSSLQMRFDVLIRPFGDMDSLRYL